MLKAIANIPIKIDKNSVLIIEVEVIVNPSLQITEDKTQEVRINLEKYLRKKF